MSDESQRKGNLAIWQQSVEENSFLSGEKQGLYAKMVDQVKRDYPELLNLPTSIIVSLIARESSFNPGAVNSSGAIGLMQVKPATAEWLAKKQGRPSGNLADPKENLLAGMSYLNWLHRKFGGITSALHAYNVGPTGYLQGSRNPGYVKSILTGSVQKSNVD